MPKTARALLQLPPATAGAIEKLGEDLAVARLRRKESLRSWAQRLGVTVSTLQRLEAGDPAVGIGIVATALWLIQRDGELRNLAAPNSTKAPSNGMSVRPSNWAVHVHDPPRKRACVPRGTPPGRKAEMRLDDLYLWHLGDPTMRGTGSEGNAPEGGHLKGVRSCLCSHEHYRRVHCLHVNCSHEEHHLQR